MLNPTVLWAQRDEYIWITVDLSNAENIQVDLNDESLNLRCDADSKEYALNLRFFKPIVKEESKFLKHRLIDFCLKKADSLEWPRLTEENVKHAWLKIDWSKWSDPDAEQESTGFDMSNMGGFGDFGMGGGGMGGSSFDNFGEDDSDDASEDQEDLPAKNDDETEVTDSTIIDESSKSS